MNVPERVSSSHPSPVTYEQLLDEVARLVRVEPEYWDIWGNHHTASKKSKEALLSALGFRTGSLEALRTSLQAYEEGMTSSPLDPVSVVRLSDPNLAVPFRWPAGYAALGSVSIAVYLEEGKPILRDFGPGQVTDSLTLPQLPSGYHDLEIVIRHPALHEQRAAQRLIVAPGRAYMPAALAAGRRMAGLAVSLYGLRSRRNWGAGDFTDLQHLVEWVARDLGAAFVALNPLHAIANRQPYNTSPYLPASSYFRNYLYLDVEQVKEFADCKWSQALVASPAIQAEIRTLRESDLVEYERVARLKLTFLRLLFRRFKRDLRLDTPRGKAFRAWAAEQGDLLDRYSTYCALDEVLHKRDPNLWIWPDWPKAYQDPGSPEVRQFVREHHNLVLFYQYVQWQVDQQLAQVQERAMELGMPIGLYHDLALATDRCGSDLWAYRQFFVHGCRVGSPPDDFSPDGQDWAFPPPNSDEHRRNRYELFAETIRRNSRHGGALRIDHVMRFYRLFWIPDGVPAREGTYVRDRFEDLLGILALESHRGRFIVVGEDLGTVPPEMRTAMESNGIFSYRLFYFEKGPGGEPLPAAVYARQALVSSTTHDLPTLAGFWAGRDIESRRAAGLLPDDRAYWDQKAGRREEKRRMIEALVREGLLPRDFDRDACNWTELTGELHNAIIGFLVSTPSQLMLLNQEDLTKELDQQNLPGTTSEYPNWRRKMMLTIEELQTGGTAKGFVEMFRNWLSRTGRLSASARR